MSSELLARRLHWAIEEDDADSLAKWLKGSADPNLVLPEGIAALHLASGKDTEGGIRCLKLLLLHGANPNVRSTESLTPLHVAASWGCVKSLKLLLRNGADPTLLDQDGLRAVDLAEEQGNVRCRQILQAYHRSTLLEDAGEDPPTYQYVCYRTARNGFHFFADPVELGIAKSHEAARLPGRCEECHPFGGTQQTSTLGQPEFVVADSRKVSQQPSSCLMRINPRNGPLGEDTSVWAESQRPWSQSGTMKAQGPGHNMGVTKDRSEHRIVGQTTELNLDSCALSSTRVSTFGKYEEQTLNELNFAADSSEDSTPADQELTLQDDESFSPVSATRLPPAVSHRLNTSTDDESFLPPSAFQPCPVGNCELNNSSNLPEAQYSPVEPLHVQRATINLYEEKEVFKEDDTFVDTEWVSELNCTCTSKDQSQSNEPLANTMLDLAKDKGFCDSELLIRPSKGKGIDITSPNNIYVFERKNPTPLHNVDKTTSFLLEDTLDYTMGTVNDGYAPHTDTAQRNSGDSKASVSISGSSSSLYCSCANGSVVFSCAVGNFGHTSHTQQAPEDPMSQAEKDQCLVRPTPSGRDQDTSVSECTGELATHNIQLVHTRDLQTLPFKDTQLFDEMLRDSPLRRTSEQPNCNSPSPQRQCSYHDASLSHSTLINPSDNDIVQSSCAGSTCTNSCVNKGLLNAVPRNAMESNPAMFPATDAHSQNHKCKRGDHSVAELVSITGRIEDGNFPGLLMLPTKKSLSSNETSLGASQSDSVSIKYSVGNKAETCSDEEDSSIEDGKEDEGSSGLEQLLKKIKIPTETGLPQIDADRLSPFVTPRTKSRLANNSLRSCSSSLFEQTLAMPVRIRRVREQQMEDARSPSGCFDSLSNESAVSHGAEDEGETRSCAHSPDSEDADFDTVPFVRCEKWTVRPPAALCPDQEEGNFDTVPFLNTKHEKGTTRSSLPGHDANRNKQCVRLKSEADANKGSQAGPVPHPVNLEEYGDANQGGCFYPPIDQSAPVAVQTDIEANSVGQMRSNTAFGGDVLWSSEDNDLQRELRISTIEQGLFGAVELPLARSRPSSQCRSPVPLAGEAEAETGAFPRNSNVCESTRLEGVDLQLGNRHQTCNFSKRSIEERLSKIPNDNAEWQSLLGNLDLQLSPGGRPVDSSVSETVEYLYTDPEEGHTLIERRYPCKDASSENLSTSGSEETVIYDWRAYKNRKFCAKVGKNMLPSDELPKLSPRLLLLSNSQIRRQLKDYGEDPGPITALTRKVYLHLLDRVRKEPVPRKPQQFSSYSPELCQSLETFVFPDCSQDELALVQQFDQPDQNRKWREGLLKSSFNYLLLDPRVTKNLPARCHTLSSAECFRTFVSSIFYVGKGKRSRPYCHLYDALTYFKTNSNQVNTKLKQILDVWESGQGVISLHCFQNVIPVEAYTREACMVDALGLQMLTNKKRGDYYGVAAAWPMKRRRQLGVHMLCRALQIFLAEGERQLRPADIRIGQ
ncbi:uncharacterized protein [Scyliorhinus torazame]|uniref:uncharacterized protein n=1 Tax=Scyliorhinus torazame TaxID=75743 RepID=UPI003B5A5D91